MNVRIDWNLSPSSIPSPGAKTFCPHCEFTERFQKSWSIPLVRQRTSASVRPSSKSPAHWPTPPQFLWEPLVVEPLATVDCCIPSWFTPPHATHSYKSRAPGTTPASFLRIAPASWVCAKLRAECMSHSFTHFIHRNNLSGARQISLG